MQRTEKEPTASVAGYLKLPGSLEVLNNFVRIDLKLSVKVGQISPRLRRSFFFSMGFLEARKMPSASATRRRDEQPKIKSAKVFDDLLIPDRAASWD